LRTLAEICGFSWVWRCLNLRTEVAQVDRLALGMGSIAYPAKVRYSIATLAAILLAGALS